MNDFLKSLKVETGDMQDIPVEANTREDYEKWKKERNKRVMEDPKWKRQQKDIAIASSDFLGKGPGNSEMRDLLPQAFSDFIYAIIIEELGLAGGIFVMFLYVFLLWRAGRIADRCANNFPAFLVMGLALLLVVQAMFNMMVAVGLAPVTGQPLPLISKGGTSTIINCIYIGAILSVSISAKRKKKNNMATAPATTD